MKDMQIQLAKSIDLFTSVDGYHETPVPGVRCIKISKTSKHEKRHWSASLGIVAQGCKEIVLGPDVYRANASHYSVAPINLPIVSRIASATQDKPFLCLLIAFDPVMVSEVAAQIHSDSTAEVDISHGGLFIGKADEKVMEAAIRLVNLLQRPEDAAVLGPLIIREMIYYLLKGTNGAAIRQFVRSGSKIFKISEAIHSLYSGLKEEVDVEALAKAANMSRSAFFKYFKEVTTMSPIQYQKKLRLLEAKRLMTVEGESAEGSAFKVGYNSASQFSREYSRMFGNSPMRDIENRT